MFLAQAHSFTQQARLAITLAWVAGYTNIITIMTCGAVTSHVSGTTSNLGRDIAEGAWGLGAVAFLLIFSFFIGAMLSGLCTEAGRRRGWESIYVLPMMVEVIFLMMFAIGLEIHHGRLGDSFAAAQSMAVLASLAMGLQNATITRISSGVVRTTHMTGVVTDLGLEVAQFALWTWDKRRNPRSISLRAAIRSIRHHPSPKRLALLGSLFGSFMIGAALGTAVFDHYPRWSMFPPVIFLLWIIYQDVSRPIAEIEPSEMMAAESDLRLPQSLAIYHLRKSVGTNGKAHQMPNLLDWIDRLPETTRVIVLDLGLDSRFEKQAVLELRAAVLRLRLSGRRLLLAGISHEQLELIRRHWGEDLHLEDVCQDFDLAVAHAINVVDELSAR